MPPTDVGVANCSPEDAPSSDATATTIASIVKSASQTLQLTEEQQDELRQCLRILLNPESSRLCKGRAMLSIIEHRLMPSRPDVVEESYALFGVSQPDGHELVKLAREDRAQNDRNPSCAGGDVRVSAPSTRKDLPDSPAPSANLKDGGFDAAQRVATEQKQSPMVAEPKGAAVAVSPVDEQAQGPTSPPIEPAQPDTTEPSLATVEQRRGSKKGQPAIELPPSVSREPADADAKATEHPTGVSGGPAVNGQSKQPQKASKRAADTAKVGTALTPIDQEQRLLQLETIVERGFTSVWEIGKAMLEIRDRQLYLKRYNTFKEYCAKRWEKQRSRCYQLMNAAKVQQNLVSTQVDIAELTEKDCRELGKLKKPADQCIAWKEAAAAAPDGKVTLPSLKEVVAKLRPPSRTMAARKTKAMTEAEVDAEAVGSEDVLPDRPPEKAVPIQPEAPPTDSSAPFASEDFDLHAEWRTVEDSLRNLFSRCPAYQHGHLWALLNSFEYAPETTHRPNTAAECSFGHPSSVGP